MYSKKKTSRTRFCPAKHRCQAHRSCHLDHKQTRILPLRDMAFIIQGQVRPTSPPCPWLRALCRPLAQGSCCLSVSFSHVAFGDDFVHWSKPVLSLSPPPPPFSLFLPLSFSLLSWCGCHVSAGWAGAITPLNEINRSIALSVAVPLSAFAPLASCLAPLAWRFAFSVSCFAFSV